MSAVLTPPCPSSYLPADEDECTSLQPLDCARVLVSFSWRDGVPVVHGCFIAGEFVDASEFSANRVSAWERGILKENEHD